MRQGTKLGIVGAQHVQETDTEVRFVRPDKGALTGHPHDVDVVREDHQIAGFEFFGSDDGLPATRPG